MCIYLNTCFRVFRDIPTCGIARSCGKTLCGFAKLSSTEVPPVLQSCHQCSRVPAFLFFPPVGVFSGCHYCNPPCGWGNLTVILMGISLVTDVIQAAVLGGYFCILWKNVFSSSSAIFKLDFFVFLVLSCKNS